MMFGDLYRGMKIYDTFPGGFDELTKQMWRNWEETEQTISERKPDVLILSSEMIFRPASTASNRLARRLQSISTDLEIVAYLREPRDFAISLFGQSLKHSRTVDLGYIAQRLNFKNIIESFQTHFDGDLRVFDYGACKQEHGSVVAHFFQEVMRIDPPEMSGSTFANVTPSPELIGFMQDYYGALFGTKSWYYTDRDFQKINRLIDIEKGFGARKPELTPAAKAWLHSQVTEHDWLTDRFGIAFERDRLQNLENTQPLDTKRATLNEIFVLDPERTEMLHRAIKSEFPDLWSSFGPGFQAKLRRSIIRLVRKAKPVLKKILRRD